jgi:Tfp pilus assembly protein PilF
MRLWVWIGLVWCLCLPLTVPGEGADDVYIRIYHLIEQADSLKQNGRAQPAYEKFDQALAALLQMQTTYPKWNEKLVQYRINYVRQKLSQLPPPAQPAPTAAATAPSKPAAIETPVEAGSAPNTALQNQVQELTSRVKQLESDKMNLDAKLREALSAQPTTVDPRELAKAEERVRSLQKENDLLKVNLEQEKKQAARMASPEALSKAQKALDEAKRKHDDQNQQIASLNQEKKVLESRLRSKSAANTQPAPRLDDAALKKQASEIERQKQLIDDLQKERDALKKALAKQTPPASSRAERRAASKKLRAELDRRQVEIDALRNDKRALEKQLAQSRDAQPKDLTRAERRALDEERRIASELESKNRSLEKEMARLKDRIKELETPPATPSAMSTRVVRVSSKRDPAEQDAKRLRELERERDDLQKKLDAALRTARTAKPSPDNTRFLQASNQLAVMQARLEVLEASKVPYSAEELAMMKVPLIPVAIPTNIAPVAATMATNQSPPKAGPIDPPSGAIPLIAQAQRAFAAGRLDEAEQNYLKVLSLDPNSVVTIGNLAAIHVEQKKFDEAEAELKKAFELDANDAYCLQLLGIVRFRQHRYDEALTALSQSAKIDPKNAETQNYLGITLSEKGFRDAAEAALRRSIQLAPQNPNAHHNLAIIYATQTPPFLELARWHYQKALATGQSRNPEMEKVLNLNRLPEETKP